MAEFAWPSSRAYENNSMFLLTPRSKSRASTLYGSQQNANSTASSSRIRATLRLSRTSRVPCGKAEHDYWGRSCPGLCGRGHNVRRVSQSSRQMAAVDWFESALHKLNAHCNQNVTKWALWNCKEQSENGRNIYRRGTDFKIVRIRYPIIGIKRT